MPAKHLCGRVEYKLCSSCLVQSLYTLDHPPRPWRWFYFHINISHLNQHWLTFEKNLKKVQETPNHQDTITSVFLLYFSPCTFQFLPHLQMPFIHVINRRDQFVVGKGVFEWSYLLSTFQECSLPSVLSKYTDCFYVETIDLSKR